MDRRTFFTITGAALSELASDWATGPLAAIAQSHDGQPVGEEFVAFLESTAQQLPAHAAAQPQHTLTLLDAHLSTVTELLEHGRYTPALGLRLHTLAASLCQTTAWHRFDLGRHSHASQHWIAGLHNAHAAGDHDMGAGLLSDLAYQAAWRSDHTTAENILNYALARAQNPAARCLLQLRLARTLAARGDRNEGRAVRRALTAAENTSTTPAPTGPPGAPGCPKPISRWTPDKPSSTSATPAAPTTSSTKANDCCPRAGARHEGCSSPTGPRATST
ncbi:hypothetical protein MQE23_42720 [Streptomyces sp. HP-A2021]|uniref:hypothetical protein n=1 Tax=Streptomyces sp. HP-A2021 TaxID=2927875 RepID=UPI001FB02103|nr:hypothetical protein [Streptomyces sp. HP-A2021]UOB15349.1 hypothetical protein MQE23_42720 [Streptomyces sp. HP-A2021]